MGTTNKVRHISKVTLNEEKVAKFLFDLFIKINEGPKNVEQPKGLILDSFKSQILTALTLIIGFSNTNDGKCYTLNDSDSKLLSFKEQISAGQLSFDLIKDIIINCANYFSIDLFIFLLSSSEKRRQIIPFLRKACKLSYILPFDSLSLDKVIETKVEKLVSDMGGEIDNYMDRNYNLTFNSIVIFLTAITIIISVMTYTTTSSLSKFFLNIFDYPFYYFLLSLMLFIFVVFLGLFLKNFYEQKKRGYLINLLDSIKEPFINVDMLNEEYLEFIYNICIIFRRFEKTVNKSDYISIQENISLILNMKGSRTISFLKFVWLIFKSNWLLIILTCGYFLSVFLLYYLKYLFN